MERKNVSEEFTSLVQEFCAAVAAMSEEEAAEIENFNRVSRESRQKREATQVKRSELVRLLTKIKKQKILQEKQILQDQIDKLIRSEVQVHFVVAPSGLELSD